MLEGSIASCSEAKKETGKGELQSCEPGDAAAEQPFLIGLGKLHDPFHMERDRFFKEAKHLFKGCTLNRKIQIEADRLPSIISPESIAMQDTLH